MCRIERKAVTRVRCGKLYSEKGGLGDLLDRIVYKTAFGILSSEDSSLAGLRGRGSRQSVKRFEYGSSGLSFHVFCLEGALVASAHAAQI